MLNYLSRRVSDRSVEIYIIVPGWFDLALIVLFSFCATSLKLTQERDREKKIQSLGGDCRYSKQRLTGGLKGLIRATDK